MVGSGRSGAPDAPEHRQVEQHQHARADPGEDDELVPAVQDRARGLGLDRHARAGQRDDLALQRRRDQRRVPAGSAAAGLVGGRRRREQHAAVVGLDADVVGAHATELLQEAHQRVRPQRV